jgi:hypothetical protein
LPPLLLSLLVLWLAGAALRLTVLAVPPVLPLLHREFALNERTIGRCPACRHCCSALQRSPVRY